ncbi:hypothetical protein [uncultured Croceitalea sp.]|uniref:hypothetical protein n=1 Tax=uncultured Croceitalea sp. TaxID=1798908 RepID=UPI0033065766
MRTILVALSIFYMFSLTAQENNDILIGVYVPPQIEPIPQGANRLLGTRMLQLVTAQGISGNQYSPRFFLVPRIAVLDKEILPTAPPRVVLNLELTLLVGDGEKEKGNYFQTEYITLKGVGQNEDKAYIAAIKTISPRNKKIMDFLEQSKKEIVAYYEEHCDEVKKKAEALQARDKLDEAVTVLANIPLSTSCYEDNEEDIRNIYQKALDQDCTRKINEARALWFADQTEKGAREAGMHLSKIEPRAWCKDELNALYDEIADRIRELSNKEWSFKLKKVDARIESARESRELVLKSLETRPDKVYHLRY